MKKLKVVIASALMAMAFSTAAFAAQAISNTGFGGMNTYQATPTWKYVYDTTNGGVYKSNNAPANLPSSFSPDGKTNYPYEIYLPNENEPAKYRIHSNYSKNTDACASCHATHTAVGESLLQWYSTYETCMACHDGTVTTTYNVEEGMIGTTGTATFGGMFGNGQEGSASKHNVQGSVSLAAAPGGSVVGESVQVGSDTQTRWIKSFGCESCHSPHGQGGNARILHPDANWTATNKAKADGYTATIKGTAAGEANTTLNGKVYFAVKPDAMTSAIDAVYNGYLFLKGYPYSVKGVVGSTTYENADITVDNSKGYTRVFFNTITPANAADVKILGVPSLKVTMAVNAYLTKDEKVQHQSGMNGFCGACHTDYNTATADTYNAEDNEFSGSAEKAIGTYSKAHRHQVGFQWHAPVKGLVFESGQKGAGAEDNKYGMECLTCHVAHGVSDDYWNRTLLQTGQAWAGAFSKEDLKEIAGSSALKRMPNMGVCEACHQKGNANEGYLANTGMTAPSGADNGESYVANATHKAFFAGNTYKDATTCLTCHPSAGDDVMGSAHWTVGGASSANKDFFGGNLAVKDSQVFTQGMPFGMSDRFCGFPGGAAGISWAYEVPLAGGAVTESNSCGKCHISINTTMPPLFTDMMAQGQGLNAEQIKANNAKNIDCLACHLDVQDYDPVVNKKVAYDANGQAYFTYGEPARPASIASTRNSAFDVTKVGKEYQIQKPDNHNCMTCHEHAQAGPVYKRQGVFSQHTDIHAAKGVSCISCHPTERHKIAKGLAATDLVTNDRPDVEVSCTTSKCHDAKPHSAVGQEGAYIDQHIDKLACQACHVKTEDNAYAKAALEYVNEGFEEKGFAPLPTNDQDVIDLFKGGAVYNDFREVGDSFTADRNGDSVSGFLQSIPLLGRTEWSMVQPGNYAWRWFNGTGTGMANALASFGFYDPYYFQDGFAAFRGTTNLPAPSGLEMMGMPPGGTPIGAAGMAQLFGGYWSAYNNQAMFAGANSIDKEYYQGEAVRKGGNGDKIYPFRKMQAWMPVPRTNFWFLTPHDNRVLKTAPLATANYESVRSAIESPMMYMFFSGMFKEAMELYAQEFGFQYMWTPVTVQAGTHPMTYDMLVAGLGGMSSGVSVLNGYIYDDQAYWLDDCDGNGSRTAITHMLADMSMGTNGRPVDETQGQAWLINGQLDSYMYFPMPLDANIMNDHAIAAKDFETVDGLKYEPRVCQDCHATPNGGSANPKPFDNPDWDPLAPKGDVSLHQDASDWGQNFHTGGSTINFDWVTLGYTKAQIDSLTSNSGPWTEPTFND